MTDEELLKAMGRAARDGQPLDERWDRLATGDLTDAEREDLLEAAARSDEAAEAYEAFRPLGAEFQARVVERLMAQRAGGATPAADVETGGHAAAAEASGASATATAARKIVPFPRRARRFSALPLALAASLLVAVGVATLLRQGATPALPGYGLRLEGQVALVRGEAPPPEAAPFAPGNTFRLVLTPETRVAGEVAAHAYLLTDGSVEPLRAPAPRISADGAVLIEGEVGRDVLLPQGPARILVVVGRESKLPDPAALAGRLGAAGEEQSGDWTAWMLPVRTE
jgi:hypothetical protein